MDYYVLFYPDKDQYKEKRTYSDNVPMLRALIKCKLIDFYYLKEITSLEWNQLDKLINQLKSNIKNNVAINIYNSIVEDLTKQDYIKFAHANCYSIEFLKEINEETLDSMKNFIDILLVQTRIKYCTCDKDEHCEYSYLQYEYVDAVDHLIDRITEKYSDIAWNNFMIKWFNTKKTEDGLKS